MFKKVAVHESLALLVLVATVGSTETPDPGSHTVPVNTGTVSATVEAVGNLDAPRTVGVTFSGPQPGLITKLPVRVGDQVDAGQELAEVDNRPATRQLELAQAALTTAKGQLAVAKETLDGDRASVVAAVRTFRNSLGAARDAAIRLRVDHDAQDEVMSSQVANLDANRRDRSEVSSSTASRTATHSRATTTNTPASTFFPGTVTTDTRARTGQRARTNSITASTTRSAVTAAGVQLASAHATRATTLAQDEQNLRQMIRQAKLARANVAVAVAHDGVGHRCTCIPGLIQEAKGAVRNAKAEVDQAQDALADTVLKAPFKGTVIDIAGDVGETPVAAARGNASPPAFPNGPGAVEDRHAATQSGFVTLADMTHRDVTAQVAEKDIRKVSIGQSAQVTFPGTGAVVAGTVKAIDLEETVVNHVVEYNVKIDLDDRAAAQRLGQSASVVITTASRPDVLSVPNAAVRSSGEGKGVVTVRRGSDYLKIPVTVGLIGDTSTEISSPSLKPGDLVVVPGTAPTPGA